MLQEVSNVINLHPSLDVAETLRHIADQIDAHEYAGNTCTMVLDSEYLYHFGRNLDDDIAVGAACYDLQLGTAILMRPALDVI